MPEVIFPTQIGDKAPFCYGMSAGCQFYSSEAQYGRSVVLLLVGADAGSAVAAVIDRFVAMLDLFAERKADVHVVVDDNPAGVLGPGCLSLPIRVIDCGNFLSRCGVGPRDVLVLVLDRNQRIAFQAPPMGDVVQACMTCLDALPVEAPRDVVMPAPAIVLPNLISQDLCRHLIDLFEASPSIDGAVARIDAAGNICSVVDHAKKHRRDMMIEPDNVLYKSLADQLLERCAPEIAKAFQVNVTNLDRVLVSRYDDSGGYFRRHRDNTAANVAFREFALSLNLNTGAYEGGHLLFPEYNDHRYAPPAGGGVIFSASVLHEAAPVTRGCRYVLLTFFYGDGAELRRRVAQQEGRASF